MAPGADPGTDPRTDTGSGGFAPGVCDRATSAHGLRSGGRSGRAPGRELDADRGSAERRFFRGVGGCPADHQERSRLAAGDAPPRLYCVRSACLRRFFRRQYRRSERGGTPPRPGRLLRRRRPGQWINRQSVGAPDRGAGGRCRSRRGKRCPADRYRAGKAQWRKARRREARRRAWRVRGETAAPARKISRGRLRPTRYRDRRASGTLAGMVVSLPHRAARRARAGAGAA